MELVSSEFHVSNSNTVIRSVAFLADEPRQDLVTKALAKSKKLLITS